MYYRIRASELQKMKDTLRLDYHIPYTQLDNLIEKHKVTEDPYCVEFMADLD